MWVRAGASGWLVLRYWGALEGSRDPKGQRIQKCQQRSYGIRNFLISWESQRFQETFEALGNLWRVGW